jgi:protein TonB
LVPQRREADHRSLDDEEVTPVKKLVAALLVASALASSALGLDSPKWRSDLIATLDKYQEYPREAAAEGVSGRVVVRFTLSRSGCVLDADVEKSSGSTTLDEAALSLLDRSQPFPSPPDEVKGAKFAMRIGVNFKLTDGSSYGRDRRTVNPDRARCDPEM